MNTTQYQNTAEARYAHRIARRLDAGSAELPYDISERLRAARMQALAQRRVASVRAFQPAHAASGTATLTLGGGPNWWNRFASALPLVALVAGLVAINMIQADHRASEVAEVDAALLTDDLPPEAYADPGFVQYLRSGADNAQ